MLLKFAPGEFVEPLSVQNLPVGTANQLLLNYCNVINLQFFIWLGREDYSWLLPSAFQANGKKHHCFKIVPDNFAEPLSVRTFPAEAAIKLFELYALLLNYSFEYGWAGRIRTSA